MHIINTLDLDSIEAGLVRRFTDLKLEGKITLRSKMEPSSGRLEAVILRDFVQICTECHSQTKITDTTRNSPTNLPLGFKGGNELIRPVLLYGLVN